MPPAVNNKKSVGAKVYSFTLIEVLVFITILSIFFVLAAQVTVSTLRNMNVNMHKIIATHYASQLEEWLRTKKETDWNTFTTKIGTYCFNSVDLLAYTAQDFSDWPSVCLPPSYNGLSPPIFTRQVTLSNVMCSGFPCQSNVSITVSWQEAGTSYSVPINTVFSVLEK